MSFEVKSEQEEEFNINFLEIFGQQFVLPLSLPSYDLQLAVVAAMSVSQGR